MATTAFEMENTRALSDPTLRARFSLSFSAQMMLSQESVKESCAAAANALLSFSGVRYRTAWTGIYFTAGGKRIAALAFFEDSLCLLLAQSAEAASGSRYKAQDVSQLRRFEKTPALLPLKSEGALKNALKKWADLAAALDLREKDAPAASRSRASRTSGAERRARGCVQRSASTILAMSRPMHMANKSRVSGRPSVSQNGIRSEGIMRVGYHAFRGEASVYSSVSRHCVKAGIRVD